MLSRNSTTPRSAKDLTSFMDHALYYATGDRLSSFEFLRSPDQETAVCGSEEPNLGSSLDALRQRVKTAGLRVALIDVTSADVARGPFRVVRALGPNFQQLHCGYGLERLGNPRLKRLAALPNPDPHPLC